jgi:hypothetical protein
MEKDRPWDFIPQLVKSFDPPLAISSFIRRLARKRARSRRGAR